ncbi:hypothetical protein CYMTET_3293 [Cymbomonas tetramitiformis]|uniref:RZ-type domain-containing protein n=1 Tax=Cymbomonas tetramitiformis TaxID=36881 RepID=A0AAE0H3E9_9CHLO|nr:hypothetical protein CYMTET_3293 [Cymbomonas tetramitiformis]
MTQGAASTSSTPDCTNITAERSNEFSVEFHVCAMRADDLPAYVKQVYVCLEPGGNVFRLHNINSIHWKTVERVRLSAGVHRYRFGVSIVRTRRFKIRIKPRVETKEETTRELRLTGEAGDAVTTRFNFDLGIDIRSQSLPTDLLQMKGVTFSERMDAFLAFALSEAQSVVHICQYLAHLADMARPRRKPEEKDYSSVRFLQAALKERPCTSSAAAFALLAVFSWFPSTRGRAPSVLDKATQDELLGLLLTPPPEDFRFCDHRTRTRLDQALRRLLQAPSVASGWIIAALPWGLRLDTYHIRPVPCEKGWKQKEETFLSVTTAASDYAVCRLDRSLAKAALTRLLEVAPTIRAVSHLVYEIRWVVDSSGEQARVALGDLLDLHDQHTPDSEALLATVTKRCESLSLLEIIHAFSELPQDQAELAADLQQAFVARLVRSRSPPLASHNPVSSDIVLRMLAPTGLSKEDQCHAVRAVACALPETLLPLLAQSVEAWCELDTRALPEIAAAFVDALASRARATRNCCDLFRVIQGGLEQLCMAGKETPTGSHDLMGSAITARLDQVCHRLPIDALLSAGRELGDDPSFLQYTGAQNFLISTISSAFRTQLGVRNVAAVFRVMRAVGDVNESRMECSLPHDVAVRILSHAIDAVFQDALCLHPMSSFLLDALCHTDHFWMYVLKATHGGSVGGAALLHHPLVRRLVAKLGTCAQGLRSGAMTVGKARPLLEGVPTDLLREYMETAERGSFPEAALDVHAGILFREHNFRCLRAFFLNFCLERAVDCSEAEARLAELEIAFPACALDEINGEEDEEDEEDEVYWGPMLTLEVRRTARSVYHLRDSSIFQSQWQSTADAAAGAQGSSKARQETVMSLARQTVPEALRLLEKIRTKMLHGPEFTIEEILHLFGPLASFERECEAMLPDMYCTGRSTKHLDQLKGDLRWASRQQELYSKAESLGKVLHLFGVADHGAAAPHCSTRRAVAQRRAVPPRETLMSLVQNLRDCFNDKRLSIRKLSESSEALDCLLRSLSAAMPTVAALGAPNAASLLAFLQRASYNEFRVALIDSAEEGSAAFLGEDVVSDLLRTKLFLDPLLAPAYARARAREPDPGRHLLRSIDARVAAQGIGDCSASCAVCASHVHALERMYNNMANRELLTRDVIQAIVERGTFHFHVAGIRCRLWAETGDALQGGAQTYDDAALGSLRSRALLFTVKELREVMARFCEAATRAAGISRCISNLCALGHVDYRDLKLRCSVEKLAGLHERARGDLGAWETSLQAAWREHYLLSFFAGSQLWQLHDWLARGVCSHNLLRVVHSDITPSARALVEAQATLTASASHKGAHGKLMAVGSTLHRVMERLAPKCCPRRLCPDDASPVRAPLVQPGQLVVARTDGHEALAAVMALFSLEGAFPERGQVLFCQAGTPWEELQAFLHRAFHAGQCALMAGKLFILAACEALSEAAQLLLVRGLRSELLAHRGRGAESKGRGSCFRIALLCGSGGPHARHLLEEFAGCIKEVAPLPEGEMRRHLSHLPRRRVLVATSERPGLGKTETIRRLAKAEGSTLITLPIFDTVTRGALVEELAARLEEGFDLSDSADWSLHVVIAPVTDTNAVSIMLFELLVVGSLLGDVGAAGATLAHVDCRDVYIEVASTPLGDLHQRVRFCSYFPRRHLEFDLQAIRVPEDVMSDMQVVCHYLQLLEQRSTDTKMLTFSNFGDDGAGSLKPLPAETCRRLLWERFLAHVQEPSFNSLNTFTAVLAYQLRIFTESAFLDLRIMAELFTRFPSFRSEVLAALIQTAVGFATRSVACARRQQHTSVRGDLGALEAEMLTTRTSQMVSWEASNHLMVILQPTGCVAALYKHREDVPPHVKDLYESQLCPRHGQALPDYRGMSSSQLFEELVKIVRHTPPGPEGGGVELAQSYEVTADNLLKMTLIHLRLAAGVPVVLMGETGCGKTSLMHFLARVSDLPEGCFQPLNVHAGVAQADLVRHLEHCEALAQCSGGRVWAFLDECNTCAHLGLINDAVCHRMLLGRPLHPDVTVIAACNPYRKRDPARLPPSAGFNSKLRPDAMSSLVYRVTPLPEGMLDFVWDFGGLAREDERRYIAQILAGAAQEAVLVEATIMSQDFVRSVEETCSVSLRDVCRVRRLSQWFLEKLEARERLATSERRHPPASTASWHRIGGHVGFCERALAHARSVLSDLRSLGHTDHQELRAAVLALLHCYYCRLATAEHRQDYLGRLAGVLRRAGHAQLDAERVRQVMRAEQLEWVMRMELPPATALNEALLENIFVLLVCVLNRLPVFLVGKPGCSKSLAFQIINSSLRGADSADSFLRTLPQLYVLSYQGSEDSRSEGIERVFDSAKRYAQKNDAGEVLPVVLLDEVGLAEVSPHNPLKVLHALLEVAAPSQFQSVDAKLDYAVVGISNWALDAAKMNRAVWISRPDPGQADLALTAKAIVESVVERPVTGEFAELLKRLAWTYHAFRHCRHGESEGRRHFHGLRDYYSLIKCVGAHVRAGGHAGDDAYVTRSIARNFGGTGDGVQSFLCLFRGRRDYGSRPPSLPPLGALVRENLMDPGARHLMLITRGDAAVSVLRTLCADDWSGSGRVLLARPVCMVGSQFADDQAEGYSYECLQQVILCMETGRQLILVGHERIYGALYDMLNQHYVVVNGRRHCRVALGADSNPMCRVHEDFRCVVLVDERRVDYSDPPFLNRFEKQLLRFGDIVQGDPADPDAAMQRAILERLESWVAAAATILLGAVSHADCDARDAFSGYHVDSLPSLVVRHASQNKSQGEVEEACKRTLMATVSADAAARLRHSALGADHPLEVGALLHSYDSDLRHRSLEHCWRHRGGARWRSVGSGGGGGGSGGGSGDTDMASYEEERDAGSVAHCPVSRLFVMTYSPLTTCPKAAMRSACLCEVVNLGVCASERHLSSRIQHFWSERSNAELLIVQCDSVLHAKHLPLCRHKMEDAELEYRQSSVAPAQKPGTSRGERSAGGMRTAEAGKSQLIVVHLRRSTFKGEESDPWQLNLLVDWDQVMVDRLDGAPEDIELLRQAKKGSLAALLSPSGPLPAEQLVRGELAWGLQCMRYPETGSRVLAHVARSLECLRSAGWLLSELTQLVMRHIEAADLAGEAPALVGAQAGHATWLTRLACDRRQMAESGTLASAVRSYARRRVRQPLAQALYRLESGSALASLNEGAADCPEGRALWRAIHLARLDISGAPPASGPECFLLPESHTMDACWALSPVIAAGAEAARRVFEELRESTGQHGDRGTPEWSPQRVRSFLRGLPAHVLHTRPVLRHVLQFNHKRKRPDHPHCMQSQPGTPSVPAPPNEDDSAIDDAMPHDPSLYDSVGYDDDDGDDAMSLDDSAAGDDDGDAVMTLHDSAAEDDDRDALATADDTLLPSRKTESGGAGMAAMLPDAIPQKTLDELAAFLHTHREQYFTDVVRMTAERMSRRPGREAQRSRISRVLEIVLSSPDEQQCGRHAEPVMSVHTSLWQLQAKALDQTLELLFTDAPAGAIRVGDSWEEQAQRLVQCACEHLCQVATRMCLEGGPWTDRGSSGLVGGGARKDDDASWRGGVQEVALWQQKVMQCVTCSDSLRHALPDYEEPPATQLLRMCMDVISRFVLPFQAGHDLLAHITSSPLVARSASSPCVVESGGGLLEELKRLKEGEKNNTNLARAIDSYACVLLHHALVEGPHDHGGTICRVIIGDMRDVNPFEVVCAIAFNQRMRAAGEDREGGGRASSASGGGGGARRNGGSRWRWPRCPPPMMASLYRTILIPPSDNGVDLVGRYLENSLRDAPHYAFFTRVLSAPYTADSWVAALACDVLHRAFAARLAEADLLSTVLQSTLQRAVWSLAREGSAVEALCSAAFSKACLDQLALAAAPPPALRDSSTAAEGSRGRAGGMTTQEAAEALNAVLGDPDNPKQQVEALRVYFLKALRRALSLEELKQASKSGPLSEALPWTRELPWELSTESRLGFNPFVLCGAYAEAKTALEDAFYSSTSKPLLSRSQKEMATGTGTGGTALLFAMASVGYLARTAQRRDWALMSRRMRSLVDTLPKACGGRRRAWLTCLAEHRFPGLEALELTAASSMTEVALASLMVQLAGLLLDDKAPPSPFAVYFGDPLEATRDFVVAMPSNELAGAVQALRGEVTSRYACSCGFAYFVGNCGSPVQSGVCPNCSKQIGSAASAPRRFHSLTDTASTVADTPGYLATGAGLASTSHSERELTPACFRILHLLTHLSLMAGSIARIGDVSGDPSLEAFMRGPGQQQRHGNMHGAVLGDCWQAATKSLGVLRELLPACTEEEVCALLHTVVLQLPGLGEHTARLETPDARSRWERAFARSAGALLADPSASARRAMAQFAAASSSATNRDTSLEGLVEEHATGTELCKSRLMRITRPPSVHSLHTALSSSANGGAESPLLRLFLRAAPDLQLLRHLPPLLEWTRLVQRTWARRLSREDARSRDVLWLLERHRRDFGQDMSQAFAAFAHGWNAAAPLVRAYECTQGVSMPTLSTSGRDVPLAVCLVDRHNEGVLVRLAAEALARVQNNFLEEVVPLVGQCAALQHLALGGGAAVFKWRPLWELDSEAVIACDAERVCEELLAFSRNDLEYGRGNGIDFGFAEMERELAVRILHNKALVNLRHPRGSLPLFQFQGEAFLEHFTLMRDVAESLPQTPLPNRDAIHEDLEKLGSVRTARTVISCLESCCFYLIRTRSHPRESLKEYCEVWAPDLAAEVPFERPALRELELQHVQQLFELAEDILAAVAVESVCDGYCKELPLLLDDDGGGSVIDALCNASVGGAASVEKGLKRFIYRFLTSEAAPEHLPPERALRDYLELLDLFGLDHEAAYGFLPPKLELAHTYKLWEHIVQRIEQESAAAVGSGVSGLSRPAAGAGMPGNSDQQVHEQAGLEMPCVRRQTRRKQPPPSQHT